MIGRTMSSLRRTLVIVFALVGFADVAVRLLLLPLTGTLFGSPLALPFGMTLERSVDDPHGRYKALVFTEEGSGLDPHCVTIVSVVRKGKPARSSWAPSDRVYVDECGRLGPLAWAPTALATLAGERTAAPRLMIDAEVRSARSMSRSAAGGAVKVEFVQ